MRVLVDAVGQEPALVEAHVARRRADQPRDRVLLHVFRHVEAQEFHPEDRGELLRDLRLADARGAGEEVVADGLLGLAQTRAGELDRGRQRLDGRVLAEDHALERAFEVLEHRGIVLRDGLRGDAGDLGDDRLDLLRSDGLPPLGLGHEMLRRARLVDHVDRLVGELAVMDVARRQLHRRLDRLGRVADVVVLLEVGLEAREDLDRVLDRRLVHVDLLEAPRQRAVLLEVLAELLVGGRAHAAQLAALKRGLQQVRRVHRAAATSRRRRSPCGSRR